LTITSYVANDSVANIVSGTFPPNIIKFGQHLKSPISLKPGALDHLRSLDMTPFDRS